MTAQTKWMNKKIAKGLCMSCGKKPIFKTNKCYTHYMQGLALAKKWNREHSEYRKEYMRQWRNENKDKVRDYNKMYHGKTKRGKDNECELNQCTKNSVGIS